VTDASGGADAAVGVLIVDDEEPARALLRHYLSTMPGVRILGECATGFEAVRAASELSPRIVFLDIEMPKLNGFEVLELLDPSIAAVFVTAYDEFAVRAFEVHAVDYVLKPYDAARLAVSLERARDRLRRGAATGPPAGDLHREARPEGTWRTRIAVRDGPRVHVIPAERLDAIEAQDDYVALKSGGKSYLKAQTLASLAASLDPDRFVRVHRSHVVRLDAVARIEPYGRTSHVAVLTDGTRVPVSREGHARLRDRLG
jgi:two-component system LytT family response regulator